MQPIRHGRARLLIALAGIGSLLAATAPVHAGTFPGTDGRILFHSDRYGATHNVFTMNADGSGVRQLTFFTSDTGAAIDASWSADGSRIVFRERPMNGSSVVRGLYLMNSDGSGQQLLYADPDYLVFAPSLSPDGTHVVFSRCPVDANACALYTIATTGGSPTAVTALDADDEVTDTNPEYSPDGRTIAFAGYNREGPDTSAIYEVSSSGGAVTRVSDPDLGGNQPDWSPDGASLVFVGGDGAIWRTAAGGGAATRLYDPAPNAVELPKYSPSGTQVVFDRTNPNKAKTFTLMVMSANGGGGRVISNGAYSSNSWYADWAPRS
jgi:Tol biopolymer transport system component